MLDMTVPQVKDAYSHFADALQRDGVAVDIEASGVVMVECTSALAVLKPEASDIEELAELERRIEDLQVFVKDADNRAYWRMDEMAIVLNAFSRYPALDPWFDWLCHEVLPAMRRYGYYNPETNHQPPPSQVLDALECKEAGRDVMNDIIPRLGDQLADAEEGGEAIE